MPKSSEQINIETSRAKSDTEFIRGGAGIIFNNEGNPVWELTEKQKEDARKEMQYDINDKEKPKQEVKALLLKGNMREAMSIALQYKIPDEFISSPEIHQISQSNFIEYLRKQTDSWIQSRFEEFSFFKVEVTGEAKKLGIQLMAKEFGSKREREFSFVKDSLGIEPQDILDYGDNSDLFEAFETEFVAHFLPDRRYLNSKFDTGIECMENGKEVFRFSESQISGLAKRVVKKLLGYPPTDMYAIENPITVIRKYGLEDEFITSPEVQELVLTMLRALIEQAIHDLNHLGEGWGGRQQFSTIERMVKEFKIDKDRLRQLIIDESKYEDLLKKTTDDLSKYQRGDSSMSGFAHFDAVSETDRRSSDVDEYKKRIGRAEFKLSSIKDLNKILLGD